MKFAGKRSFYFFVLALLIGLLLVLVLRVEKRKKEPEARSIALKAPEGRVELSIYPLGRLETTSTPIFLRFNRPAGPEGERLIKEGPVPFRVEPAVVGRYVWKDPQTLVFYPEREWAPSTTYRIKLNKNFFASRNMQIPSSRVFTFSTPAFKAEGAVVLSVFPGERAALLDLWFSFPVKPGEVAGRIKIKDEKGEPLPFLVSPAPSSKHVILRVEALSDGFIKGESSIYIEVEEGLKTADGSASLSETALFSLRAPTSGPLKLEKYRFQEGRRFRLTLTFSHAVHPEKARSFIEIIPARPFRILSLGRFLLVLSDFKSGEEFLLVLRKGLPSLDGKRVLKKDIKIKLKVPNRRPYVRFLYKGKYMRRSGSLKVPVVTVNIGEIRIEVRQIFPNNLVFWHARYYEEYSHLPADRLISRIVLDKKVKLKVKKNEEQVHFIDLSELIERGYKGVFQIRVLSEKDYYLRDTLWLTLTDIGIVHKLARNRMTVWALRMDDLTPIEGAEVKLLTINNQEVYRGRTDPEGKVVIERLKEMEKVGKIYMVVVSKGDDFSYADLRSSRIDLADYDTGGDSYFLSRPYQAFLYTERGVYRPGEKLHLTAVVRDQNLNPPGPVPAVLSVLGPDGRLFKRLKAKLDEQGMASFELELPGFALTGFYRASLTVGRKVAGSAEFQVEEFVPERIKVEVELSKKAFNAGEEVKGKIKARYLFGPPVVNQPFFVRTYLKRERKPFPALSDYVFGTEPEGPVSLPAGQVEGRLGSSGEAEFSLRPAGRSYIGPMRLEIIGEVAEAGSGRVVQARASALFHPFPLYIGLQKPAGVSPEFVQLKGVLVDSQGRPVAGKRRIRVRFYRVEYEWVSYYDPSQHRFFSRRIYHQVPVDEREVEVKEGRFKVEFVPGWGRYRIEAEEPESGSKTELKISTFWWEEGEEKSVPPERLLLSLSRKEVSPGQSVELAFDSPFEGRALIAVEGPDLLYYSWREVKRGPVKEKLKISGFMYYPNLYVSVLVIKRMGRKDPAPVRAFGVAWLKVKPVKNRLSLKVEAPELVRPGQELVIKVETEKGAHVTVAAVDEGVLQLTSFKTPSPLDYFFRKRRLQVFTHDIFGQVMPELSTALRSGAGKAAGKRLRRPLRVKPVSFWSGILKLKEGKAEVRFKLPNFTGKLRIMVVAVKGSRFASESGYVTVRSPISVMATLPRFVYYGDSIYVPVEVFNNTSRRLTLKVRLRGEGLEVLAERDRQIVVGGLSSASFVAEVLVCRRTGGALFEVTAEAGREKALYRVELPVYPRAPYVRERHLLRLEKGKHLIKEPFRGWEPLVEKTTLVITPFPYIQQLSFVKELLTYPYGCIEQTTSSTFPLLYMGNILKLVAPELARKASPSLYIRRGIDRIISMQTPSGGFAFWPGSTYPARWPSIYATHLLLEARRAGHYVPDFAVENAITYLKSLDFTMGRRPSPSTEAYRLFVLALSGMDVSQRIRWLLSKYADSLSLEAKALAAGGLALCGDYAEARQILEGCLEEEQSREAFGSDLRSDAVRLYVMQEMGRYIPQAWRYNLIQRIAGKIKARRPTTQEMAWTVMALAREIIRSKAAPLKVSLSVDGKRIEVPPSGLSLTVEGLSGKELIVENLSDSPAYLLLMIEGIKLGETFREEAKGLKLVRNYYTLDGKLLDASQLSSLKPAQLLVVELVVEGRGDNLAVVDRLAAGFEVENPRLGRGRGPSWVKQRWVSDYIDIKDDRVEFFGQLRGKAKIYYMVRATVGGSYFLPPATAELMYEPDRRASTSPSAVVIKAQ